jgi:hypothetical protein
MRPMAQVAVRQTAAGMLARNPSGRSEKIREPQASKLCAQFLCQMRAKHFDDAVWWIVRILTMVEVNARKDV